MTSFLNILYIHNLQYLGDKFFFKKIPFQKKEESNLFDPLELREKLTKISSKTGTENEQRKHEEEFPSLPIQEKLEEIKTKIDQNKTDTDEQFEKTQNGIREVNVNKYKVFTPKIFQVQDQVGNVDGVINRIVTQFVFSIQGFFFCFIFGIVLIGIGLKRNPQVLDYW